MDVFNYYLFNIYIYNINIYIYIIVLSVDAKEEKTTLSYHI